MSSNAGGGRRYKALTNRKRIIDILNSYDEDSLLFVKTSGAKYKVKKKQTDKELSVSFNSKKKFCGKHIRLFYPAESYMECECAVDTRICTADGSYDYTVHVKRLLIPQTKRRDTRYAADEHYQLGKISFSLVCEEPEAISRTSQYKNYIKQMRKKLDFFSFVGVYPFDTTAAPTEVLFSRITRSILFIRDLSSYKMFLKKNETFFKKNPDIYERLDNRLKTLNMRYSSLLVRPVDYLPMVGDQFPVAFVVAAKERGEVQNDDILAIDEASLELYTLLTSSFIREKTYRGSFVNLSVSGARVYIEEIDHIEDFRNIEVVSCVLRILGVADIAVSGVITYIQEARKGFYFGLEFKRSVFGNRFPKFLFDTIQTYKLSPD